MTFAITPTSCGASANIGARDTFVHDVSCPPERVEVRAVPPREPPVDVANDPERLAIWRSTETERQREEPGFVVTGCGARKV
jgi:hypothetical protein